MDVISANAMAAVLLNQFLPREETQAMLNIPTAITKFHPLPQEELLIAYSRGNSYLISGMFEEAVREFNHALDISPDNAEVLISRGIANEKVLRWDQAIKDYKTANQILKFLPFASDDATCISNIANAETGLSQWTEALRDFNYAAKLQPGLLAPQIGRALVLYQLDQPQEALQCFLDLTGTYPDFADGLAAAAVISYEQGKVPEAISLWQKAVDNDDRYKDAVWVEQVRRWPPKLTQALIAFQRSPNIKIVT